MKAKALLLIYGEGGHNAQMQRLLGKVGFTPDNIQTTVVALNDSEKVQVPPNVEQFILPALRDKHSGFSTLLALKGIYYSIKYTYRILRQYDCRMILSTGPGIAIIPSLIFRLLGKQVIHVETWSRFDTASHTGKLMYKLATRFYVQNQEQSALYPKAIWAGRL
jgi:UDP-N-acetylglucosamine:LPS N-acetylglucosamine transferase